MALEQAVHGALALGCGLVRDQHHVQSLGLAQSSPEQREARIACGHLQEHLGAIRPEEGEDRLAVFGLDHDDPVRVELGGPWRWCVRRCPSPARWRATGDPCRPAAVP